MKNSGFSGTPISDFDFKINKNILYIKDLNLGNMSVTNNIKNVLRSAAFDADLLVSELLKLEIIYKDSNGNIDGINLNEDETLSNITFYSLDNN